ncbi:MAG: hypothetical protein V4596_14450 [Bdellovibrionota bacterium]
MKKLILIVVSMFAIHAQANLGADGGGGGGVFCLTKDKCVTLAEAGLRIKQDVAPKSVAAPPANFEFVITQDVLNEVDAILKTINKNSKYRFKVGLANLDLDTGLDSEMNKRYKVVEAYDGVKYKRIISDYNKILKEEGYDQSFSIGAVSDRDTTYLLPDYFKLNSRSKALLLIHENLVRAVLSSTLEYAMEPVQLRIYATRFALKLDGYLLDLLNDKNKNSYALALLKDTLFDGRRTHPIHFYYIDKYEAGVKIKFDDKLMEYVSSSYRSVHLGNEQVARVVYNADHGFWNHLVFGQAKEIMFAPAENANINWGLPEEIDTISYCADTADGWYFVGFIMLQCKSNLPSKTSLLHISVVE